MRYFLLILIGVFCVNTPAFADSNQIYKDLTALAQSVGQAQDRMTIINSKLSNIEAERDALNEDLNAERFKLVKYMHNLHRDEKTPLYLHFLASKHSFLGRYYDYRTRKSRIDIAKLNVLNSIRTYTELTDKIEAIKNYKHEQELLRLTIDAGLEDLKTLRKSPQNNAHSEQLASMVKELKEKNKDLNSLIEGLLDLPALKNNQALGKALEFILPVSGIVEKPYSPIHSGVTMNAMPQAIVHAPETGNVIYADDYKNLGPIVIINHGQGYISTLQGLNDIFVTLGQHVKKNDPVGILGAENMGSNRNGAMLYYELRYNGQTTNPITEMSGL